MVRTINIKKSFMNFFQKSFSRTKRMKLSS